MRLAINTRAEDRGEPRRIAEKLGETRRNSEDRGETRRNSEKLGETRRNSEDRGGSPCAFFHDVGGAPNPRNIQAVFNGRVDP
jgi:hypothetical protein